MLTYPARRSLDDLKLAVLELLSSLWRSAEVRLAAPSNIVDCDMDALLETMTEGGQVWLTFSPATCRVALRDMTKAMKRYQRGLITHIELTDQLWESSGEMLEAVEDCLQAEQETRSWAVDAEIRRVICLLLDPPDSPDIWDDEEETDPILPRKYLAVRYEHALALLQSLVRLCGNETALQQRAELAAQLVKGTTGEGLWVTDAGGEELLSSEIEAIVNRGGTIRIAVLSEANGSVLAGTQRLIADWYANRLSGEELCHRLKARLKELDLVDPDWWDTFHRELGDLWIVAFGRCRRQTRGAIQGMGLRQEMDCLVDGIDQLLHAPLRCPQGHENWRPA